MPRAKSTSLWYPRYVGDYKRKTSHLSMTEHGAYAMLMDHYYSTGNALPTSVPVLRRICSAFEDHEVDALKSVLLKFFVLSGDSYHHERADEELAKRSGISKKRRDAVNSRPDRIGTNVGTNEDTSTTTSILEEPPTPTGGFERFWNLYPNKIEEPAARKAFAKAEAVAGIDVILAGVTRYVATKPPTQAWKKPAGWLRGERWNDQPAPTTPSKVVPFVSSGPKRTYAEILEDRAKEKAASGPASETVLIEVEGYVS